MPATPAWPPPPAGLSGVRLFVAERLTAGATLRIDGAQAHYLVDVMRLREGAAFAACDDVSGEWCVRITAVAKRHVDVSVETLLRAREAVADLWLAAAPIRRARYDWVAEKACELGVARFVPVLTRRTVVDRVKPERLRAHMIEAAEQCGRTALPELADETTLARFLATLSGRTLFFADEAGGVRFADAIAEHRGPAAILIGPEGGFAQDERAVIAAHGHAVAISLGPLILRADTAAVAAVATWLALT